MSKLDDIKGGNVEYNYNKMLELFCGKKNAYYDIVKINTAYILLLSGKFGKIKDCLSYVDLIFDKKLPLKLLNDIKNGS
jgi:anthranilate phosphoribosyltransferase